MEIRKFDVIHRLAEIVTAVNDGQQWLRKEKMVDSDRER